MGLYINYIYLKRENIPETYRDKRMIHSGLLYTDIIAETLELYMPTTESEFRVFCDKRHLKKMKQSDFKNTLLTRLLPLLPSKTITQIEMVDSTTSSNIQLADWISGAIAAKYNNKPDGDKYYEVIEKCIKQRKELFKSTF